MNRARIWSSSNAILSSVACHAQCASPNQVNLIFRTKVGFKIQVVSIDIKSWIGCNEKDSACGLKSIDLWTRGGHFIAVQQSKRIARLATFWHLPTNQPTKYNRNFNIFYLYFNSQTLVQNISNLTTSCRTSRKYFAKETVFFDIFCHKDLPPELKPRRDIFSCFESLLLFAVFCVLSHKDTHLCWIQFSAGSTSSLGFAHR